MRRNQIREILKVAYQPGMVSLAGGIPAPETFPIEELYRLNEAVLDRYGATSLQYDLTEGFTPFREALASYLAKKRICFGADEILVFNGSQSVLDTLGKVLISPGIPSLWKRPVISARFPPSALTSHDTLASPPTTRA